MINKPKNTVCLWLVDHTIVDHTIEHSVSLACWS